MLDTKDVDTYKNIVDVALLPETNMRLEAAMIDMLFDIQDKMPSVWADKSYHNVPRIEVAEYLYSETHKGSKPGARLSLDLEANFLEVLEFATSISMEDIRAKFERVWERHGMRLRVTINVRGEMDPDYLQTLKNLGKIRKSEGYTSPPTEDVYCPIGSNDIPF